MTAIDVLRLPQAYALTVDDYVMLSKAGALADFAKTELIEGVIVPVNALYSAHARAQRHFFRELDAACSRSQSGLEVVFEVSVRISRRSMPRPDVLVTRKLPFDGPVEIDDVALIVEITDSTHDADLGPKPELYASAGIPEYWVVDLVAREVLMMSDPIDGSFSQVQPIAFGDPVTSSINNVLSVTTDAL